MNQGILRVMALVTMFLLSPMGLHAQQHEGPNHSASWLSDAQREIVLTVVELTFPIAFIVVFGVLDRNAPAEAARGLAHE